MDTTGSTSDQEESVQAGCSEESPGGGRVKILHFYMTTGTHDMMFIAEAPNDEAMAKAMLSTIATGSITTQTSRAFTEVEYRKIMKSL